MSSGLRELMRLRRMSLFGLFFCVDVGNRRHSHFDVLDVYFLMFINVNILVRLRIHLENMWVFVV